MHRKIRAALAASGLTLLSACATGENMHVVNIGMNREQVVQMLGRPDGDQVAGNFEALRYSDRLMSGWSWNRADYQVLLQDGRVTAYGPGAVRQEGPRVLVLVPLGR